ncbi:MAG: VWA domain-containing protein [Anaerolineales bacterium]|nr:VWA domain-containing protein [Anaerolineales bacterium]
MQNVIGGLFSAIVTNWHKRIGRKRRGCRRLSLGCASLLLLLALVACGLLFWVMVFQPQTAAAAYLTPDNLLAVTLLIDNSHSMFELGGQGSDPQLLRLDAARLFISYLGVDNPQADHACSVIFFGSEAQVVVPMTRLADDQRRQDIYHLIQNPPRMGWTDHVAALALAQSQPLAEPIGRQPAFILLTDGKPDWSNEATEAEKQAYAARLRQVSQQLTQSETPLFIILLANDATDADPDIARIWQPLWQEMAAATAPGQFYEARQADDLVSIYHDIVVILTGGRLAPPYSGNRLCQRVDRDHSCRRELGSSDTRH